MQDSKAIRYADLVQARKVCRLCEGLTNPSVINGGAFDSDHIGAWSMWQGNLDAQLMVVGQDWGDAKAFHQQLGRSSAGSPTNRALVELVSVAGIRVDAPGITEGSSIAFFTNAILCMKGSEGGLQGKVQASWFESCAPFLRRQIEIVQPSVVVGLGERAYSAILSSFGMESEAFRSEVELPSGRLLPNGARAFAVYHCGVRIRNTHRPMEMQRRDWERLRPFLS